MKLEYNKKRMNEAYVTDYLEGEDISAKLDKLASMLENPKFGIFHTYNQLPNMTVRTTKIPHSEFPGLNQQHRYWKFVKNDDGSWEVTEVDENSVPVEPRVNFVLTESKKRMNESASMDMFRSCAEDIYDSEIRKLNTTITVTGRYSGEVWDDGRPVLKYFDRGQTKKLRQTFNPGEVFISGYTRSGKIEAWFSVGGGWLLVDQNQLAFCCDVCNENDFDDISEILE